MNTKEYATPAERMELILELLNKTKNNFAKEMGFKSAMSIYNITLGRADITEDLANKIVTKYPQFNYNYVRTGKGVPVNENYKTGSTASEILYEHSLSDSEILRDLQRRQIIIEKLLIQLLEKPV